MNATTQTPAQKYSTASSLMAFLQGIGITLLFGIAIVFSHYDTKSQIKEQSAVIEEVTRNYVKQQQDKMYDRVEQLVSKSIDSLRTESEKTNMLLQRLLDEPQHTSGYTSGGSGNTATSTSSVVNTPSTTLQAP